MTQAASFNAKDELKEGQWKPSRCTSASALFKGAASRYPYSPLFSRRTAFIMDSFIQP